MNYKCIIFDCDGVLVDSESISSAVLTSMTNELGATISNEEALHHFTGKSLKFCLDYIESVLGKPLPTDFDMEFRKRSFEQFSLHLQPIEGIHELLNSLNYSVLCRFKRTHRKNNSKPYHHKLILFF